MAGCFVLAGVEYASAQSAASSSKEVVRRAVSEKSESKETPAVATPAQDSLIPKYEKPIPPHIDECIEQGKFTEALNEFEKYKASKRSVKKERNTVLSVEVMFYQRMSEFDIPNSARHRADRDRAIKRLLKEFPQWSETYQFAITPDFPPEKVIEYCTKSIELDPDNLRVRERRANTYYDMGEVDKACADYEKLPYKEQLWQYKTTCQKESRP